MTNSTDAKTQAAPVRGARGLLGFHSAVLTWWVVVQLYHRVVVRLATIDQMFWFGVVSWGIITVAPLVILRFARGRHGTSAAPFAYLALALAIVDFCGETLQFSPQFGAPALIPSDHGMAELIVRSVWVSCEFLMRSAVFVALWRSQAGASKLVWNVFFALVAVHWVGAIISQLRDTEQYAAWWSTMPATALFARFGWVLAISWMSLLVWLSRRVASSDQAPT